MNLREYVDAINPVISTLIDVRDDAEAALRLKSQGLLGGAQNRADVRAALAVKVAEAATAMTALTLDSDT